MSSNTSALSAYLSLVGNVVNPQSQMYTANSTPSPFLTTAGLANAAAQSTAATTATQPYNALAATQGYTLLRYPLDGGVYYIGLFIQAYQRPSIYQPLTITSTTAVALPVPAQLVDAQSVQYTPVERGAVVGLASEGAAKQALGPAGQAGGGGAAGAVASLKAGAGGIGDRAAQGAADAAVEGFGSAVAQQLGQAPNPFLTVQFTSPEFKQHTFSWMFAPRTPAESTQIQNICQRLRYAMLPSLGTGGGVYLKYPDIIFPVLYPNQAQLYTFKPCVMPSMVVNYAPCGQPSFFAGTKCPTHIELTIHLMEIELWLKDNFNFLPNGS